jgi:hypothetical protein
MVIAPDIAHRFIRTYMDFLGSLLSDEEKHAKSPAQWLVVGRDRFMAGPEKIVEYRATHTTADVEILDAIATLKVQQWIYLKDTRTYSIWLDEHCQAAYGVLGLTERLRQVAQGQSGVTLRSGLMAIQGRWFSDGLVQNFALLGPNYRRGFTESYEQLRKAGRFSLGPE